MWLDRFSNQPTSSGASTPNRSYSPAPPRRASHLAPSQRNGINLAANRSTSSFDLSLNSSSTSLPILSRAATANSSVLRYEQKPPEDVQDPLTVLERVLNIDAAKATSNRLDNGQEQSLQTTEDEIDFHGLSLEEYASRDTSSAGQRPQQQGPAPDIRAARQQFSDLHDSIEECDDVLESVESYLTNFKAELGQVSAEIESLQARSMQLNAQLNNRRKVEKLLGPAVEELSISPATVRSIADGPIDDTFGRALTEVEARHLSITSKHKDVESKKAVEDILPLLEDLKTRAVERVRDYLVSQIKALRSPNINAQVIQQQTFLKHKELYPFLCRNHPTLADEIGQAYVYTMRWYFNSNFTRYRAALDKLQLYPVGDADLLGTDPTTRRVVLSGSKGSQSQHDAFNLGKRADVLKARTESAIPSHLAEDSKVAHYIEVPFQNFNRALIDNVSAEYACATELFSSKTYHQVSRKVIDIFEPTFTLGHDLTKSLVENYSDCLGILICVRLNQRFAFETQKRKVPVLDSYINYTNILLWPRFQKVMDLHCDSLKRVSTGTNRGAAAAFSLVGGSDASKASVAPHAITQRFGQFLHGILTLSAEAGDDEPVANSLIRLRTEYETLMGKLAKNAGDASKRGRFLYNNYSLVLTIIGDTQGKLAEEQKEHFSMLMRDVKPR